MAGTDKTKKYSSELNIEEKLKELKELLHETRNKVTSLETQMNLETHLKFFLVVGGMSKFSAGGGTIKKKNLPILLINIFLTSPSTLFVDMFLSVIV